MRSSLILHLRIAHTKPHQTNRFDSCVDTEKGFRRNNGAVRMGSAAPTDSQKLHT